MGEKVNLKKVDDQRWLIPKSGGMRVDGLIYASEKMLHSIQEENCPVQVANVAQLPGILKWSLAMPDIHWGYGFAIGGVAAFDMEDGIISPGGVGYDINCGVRVLRTNLCLNDIKGKQKEIVAALFSSIPTGVGSHRKDFKLTVSEERKVLNEGARWAVANGFGSMDDLEFIEEGGCIPGADASFVSEKALTRGRDQLGTLGSGNHFVEVGFVSRIFDEGGAKALGLQKDQVTITVHTGSRGLGYQICDDYIKVMLGASKKYGIQLPDRQLCCAPLKSEEGRRYFKAMAAAANYAFANRQMITHWVREAMMKLFKASESQLGLQLVYDVAHNIAKIEEHTIDGRKRKVCVHRKGATRAFPPGSKEIPQAYRNVGQPVLIPGDMGRCSYVLLGTEKAQKDTFGSACHGAGRVLSRSKAIKSAKGRPIARELEDKGIYVRCASKSTLAEEMPEAYKDVSMVVDVVHRAGIAKKVVQLKPMALIKG